MQQLQTKIASKQLYLAFKLMHQKKFDEAEKALEEGLKEAEAKRDSVLQGVYYSAFGVLWKLKKDFRKAWKYYEQAEKLIPEDPALKIISSRLLVDFFGQYDTAIRKMDKAIKQAGDHFPYLHQAYAIKGLSYLHKGDKRNAAYFMKCSMGDRFQGMQSASNIDFALVQEMVKKKIELPLCKDYLEKARDFAKEKKEALIEKTIQRLLELFPA